MKQVQAAGTVLMAVDGCLLSEADVRHFDGNAGSLRSPHSALKTCALNQWKTAGTWACWCSVYVLREAPELSQDV